MKRRKKWDKIESFGQGDVSNSMNMDDLEEAHYQQEGIEIAVVEMSYIVGASAAADVVAVADAAEPAGRFRHRSAAIVDDVDDVDHDDVVDYVVVDDDVVEYVVVDDDVDHIAAGDEVAHWRRNQDQSQGSDAKTQVVVS